MLEEAKSCISNTRATQVKYLGLQNNIKRLCKLLNEKHDEILAILEPENIKYDVLESMRVMKPVHEEVTFKLENMTFMDSKQSFGRGDNKISNTKLLKLEFPVSKGNPLEWQSFYDQFSILIHQIKTLTDIDWLDYLRGYLTGEALAAISGLTLNFENDEEALSP